MRSCDISRSVTRLSTIDLCRLSHTILAIRGVLVPKVHQWTSFVSALIHRECLRRQAKLEVSSHPCGTHSRAERSTQHCRASTKLFDTSWSSDSSAFASIGGITITPWQYGDAAHRLVLIGVQVQHCRRLFPRRRHLYCFH